FRSIHKVKQNPPAHIPFIHQFRNVLIIFNIITLFCVLKFFSDFIDFHFHHPFYLLGWFPTPSYYLTFILSITYNRMIVKYLLSEEHTSELQSRFDLVCRLLLEKKKCI